MLKHVLDGAKQERDFILLDCTFPRDADRQCAGGRTHHLIPITGSISVCKGLEQLCQTVCKKSGRKSIQVKIRAFCPTMTDNRTNCGQQIDNLIRQACGSKIKVFDQTIPRSVRAAEISAVGKSIFQYDPKGKVAEAYKSLTREVMAECQAANVFARKGRSIFSTERVPTGAAAGTGSADSHRMFPFKNHPFKVLDSESMQRGGKRRTVWRAISTDCPPTPGGWL